MKMHRSKIIEIRNVSKCFGSTKALTDVSIDFYSNSIHAVLGENGAGKSTLMNIIGGVVHQDSGELIIEGKTHSRLTPKKCIELGISFVHQELSLIEDLNVYQNIFLGSEIIENGIMNKKKMISEAQEIIKKLGVEINPEEVVSNLSSSQRQIVEIAKNLLYNPKVMILDEPTSALENFEITQLFEMMKKLKDEGVAIIYISHKMPEIFEICDEFTVLRDGINVACGELANINEAEVIEHIVGEDVKNLQHKKTSTSNKEIVLSANQLSLDGVYEDISFNVNKGEVLVFTGLQGDGRLELLESIYGIRKNSRGSIKIEKNIITKTKIKYGIKNGIAFVPSNRKINSIIPDLSILSNFKINNLNKFYYNNKTSNEEFKDYIDMLSIKFGKSSDLITSLSGGNQQKVILSRALKTNPKVLILDNPTQGIDIKAKEEVYKVINDLADNGLTIIVSSTEVPEIQKIAHRCLVMYNKKIVKEFLPSEISESTIMEYATGMREGEYKCKIN